MATFEITATDVVLVDTVSTTVRTSLQDLRLQKQGIKGRIDVINANLQKMQDEKNRIQVALTQLNVQIDLLQAQAPLV